MHQVLLYLLRSSKPLVPEEEIADMLQWEELEWQKYAEECKGMIVTNPGMVRPPAKRQEEVALSAVSRAVVAHPHPPLDTAGIRLSLLARDTSNATYYPQGRLLVINTIQGPKLLCHDEVG